MSPTEKVAIISIGEMGMGIAKLLSAHGYTVLTNITGRSEYTYKRATAASITLLSSDAEVVAQADYILSIVPPRDALATAKRFASIEVNPSKVLYYLDLNATSPGLARKIEMEFQKDAPGMRYVDGGIIGGPPRLIDTTGDDSPNGLQWKRPSIPISGPYPVPNTELIKVLNMTYLGPKIGSASGLKCCFASIVKGLIALAIQSFSTAKSLGVYEELQNHLELFQPALKKSTTTMVTEIPPKAGRWVDEMWEIGRCFGEEGGWNNIQGDGRADANVYKRIAEVYKTISEDTVLGQERPEHRVRGTTADDVAAVLAEALNNEETLKVD